MQFFLTKYSVDLAILLLFIIVIMVKRIFAVFERECNMLLNVTCFYINLFNIITIKNEMGPISGITVQHITKLTFSKSMKWKFIHVGRISCNFYFETVSSISYVFVNLISLILFSKKCCKSSFTYRKHCCHYALNFIFLPSHQEVLVLVSFVI